MKRRWMHLLAGALGLCLTAGNLSPVQVFGEEVMTEEVISEEASGESISGEEVSKATFKTAKDWDEVFQALKKVRRYYYETYAVEDVDYAVSSSAATSSAKVMNESAATGSTMEYSGTNLRDSRVDEADVVKTDGKHIYQIRNQSELVILSANGSDTQVISRIDLKEVKKGDDLFALAGNALSAREIFVDGDTLSVICEVGGSYRSGKNGVSRWYDLCGILTFDIQDPAAPVYQGSRSQVGSYFQARKIENQIYLYTTSWPDVEDTLEESALSVFINNQEVPVSDYCIPEHVDSQNYLIVSSGSIHAPTEIADQKVVISGADNVYVTTNHTYVMQRYSRGDGDFTQISSLSMLEGGITPHASCSVKGTINDSFAIDEYNGYLRVLTTYTGTSGYSFSQVIGYLFGIEELQDDYYNSTWARYNALYVLDEELRRVGRLRGIAENESVESTRFFGDRVYFVTYENTDPVFCADLSEPKNPKIISEFKTTGFSAYLHPYGDGRLLGMGYETDPETGETLGVKLSMFNIETDGVITETDRVILPGITWCEALGNYKELFVSEEKNLIGFYHDDRYFLYRYDDAEGFTRALLYDYYGDDLAGVHSADTMRGLYVGEELYLAGGSAVIGFDMANDFEQNLLLKQ